MNRLHLLPAIAAMLLWQAAPADKLVDASDPARLAELIRGLGYRAAVESDNLGDPMITSAAGGDTFVICFFGCSDNRDCSALLFKIGFFQSSMRRTFA